LGVKREASSFAWLSDIFGGTVLPDLFQDMGNAAATFGRSKFPRVLVGQDTESHGPLWGLLGIEVDRAWLAWQSATLRDAWQSLNSD